MVIFWKCFPPARPKESLRVEKGWLADIGHISWWHMEYAQHAAHKLKFKEIIIQTSPMVVLENIKGPTQWLKVTKILHSKSDLSFSFVTLVSYAIMCYTLDTVDFTLLIYILDKWLQFVLSCLITMYTQITKFMGPTWGPPGFCQPQMGPMLAPWTLHEPWHWWLTA